VESVVCLGELQEQRTQLPGGEVAGVERDPPGAPERPARQDAVDLESVEDVEDGGLLRIEQAREFTRVALPSSARSTRTWVRLGLPSNLNSRRRLMAIGTSP
jgi:hypothetical protein